MVKRYCRNQAKNIVTSAVPLLAACALACAADEESIGRATGSLVNGMDDDDATPEYPAVVFVRRFDPDPAPPHGLCSGTLISPTVVLTAAHCLTSEPSLPPGPLTVYFGSHPLQFDFDIDQWVENEVLTTRTVDEADCVANSFYPTGDDGVSVPGDQACFSYGFSNPYSARAWDFAVLKFDEPVPVGWAVPPGGSSFDFQTDFHRILQAGEAPAVGDMVDAVGYGIDTPIGGPDFTAGQRRLAHSSIDVIDPQMVRTDSDHLSEGDSGGPVIWTAAADPLPHSWPKPPIGVACCAVSGATVGDVYANLHLERKLAWLRRHLDENGDGRFDYRHCSRATAFDPNASPATDPDGDGILTAGPPNDNCPNVYNPCQEDGDLDGVGDGCDTCPTESNGGEAQHRDSDGDEVVDACDNCPWMANSGQANSDEDRHGDACDNCPTQANPGQENCNADAEWAHEPRLYDPETGLLGIGDACDPVPCAETTIHRPNESTGGLNEIRANALRAEWEYESLPAGPIEGRTGFRFCRCNVAFADFGADGVQDRRDCRELVGVPPDGPWTGECEIGQPDLFDDIEETLPWRQITFEHQPPVAGGSVPPLLGSGRLQEAVLEYADPVTGASRDAAARWSVDTDIARWTTAFTETIPYGPTAPMRGVLWTHTPGYPGEDFTPDVRTLSSHYWSGGVRPQLELRTPITPCFRPIGPFFDPQHCLTCAIETPVPWLVSLVDGPCAPTMRPDFDPVFQFGDTWLGWDELWTDPYPEHFSPDHPDWEDTRWVAVTDARSAGESRSLRYVRIALDGTVRAMLHVTEDGFIPACDGCPNEGDAPSVETFVATASARHQAVWLASTGDSQADIWRYDAFSGEWHRLPDVEVVLPIHAIGYDAFLDRLLVLGGPPGERVLSEVGVSGGGLILAELGGAGAATSFALTTNDDGSLYVVAVAGGVEEGGHCAVRFVPEVPASGSPMLASGGTTWQEGYVPPEAVTASAAGLSLVAFNNDASWLRDYETFVEEPTTCLSTF